jgi:hypothetical protein
MNEGPKPTRVPGSPARVRRGHIAAITLGVGLGGACGGEVLGPTPTPNPEPPTPSPEPPTPSLGGDASLFADSGVESDSNSLDAAGDVADLQDASVSDVIGHLHDVWSPPCGVKFTPTP